jgi:hypothetical protein
MELICQIFAPSSVPIGKETPMSVEWKAVGNRSQTGHYEERNITCSFRESKNFYLRRPFHSLVTISTDVFELLLPYVVKET